MKKEIWGETIVKVPLRARWTKEVYRARPEGGWHPPEIETLIPNLIVSNGMDYLASRIGSRAVGTNSTMSAIAVGTVSTAATLNQTAVTGEVDRKLFGSTSLNGNIWILVNTWGGSADSVTSVNMQEAGVLNSAVSGAGVMFQRVVYASVVLANSDLLKLQIETTVGSR